jgi:outer membrane lipoprotein SlyB
VLDLQQKMQATLKDMDGRLRAIEDRMTRLEVGQGQIITEARAAAGAAATGLAGSVIAEVVTRVTRVEMRQEDMHRRLPPPGQ